MTKISSFASGLLISFQFLVVATMLTIQRQLQKTKQRKQQTQLNILTCGQSLKKTTAIHML
jgi:hypothetical protein